MADYQVHLDDAAIYAALNSVDSPVTALLEELSEQAAAVARSTVPIRKTRLRNELRSTSFPPGYTLESIRTNVHWYKGLVYGGIAAEEEPTIFLEYPARQMHRQYPFLSTGFDSLFLDF